MCNSSKCCQEKSVSIKELKGEAINVLKEQALADLEISFWEADEFQSLVSQIATFKFDGFNGVETDNGSDKWAFWFNYRQSVLVEMLSRLTSKISSEGVQLPTWEQGWDKCR